MSKWHVFINSHFDLKSTLSHSAWHSMTMFWPFRCSDLVFAPFVHFCPLTSHFIPFCPLSSHNILFFITPISFFRPFLSPSIPFHPHLSPLSLFLSSHLLSPFFPLTAFDPFCNLSFAFVPCCPLSSPFKTFCYFLSPFFKILPTTCKILCIN